MAQIALVDDDKKLSDLLRDYLEENNHRVFQFFKPTALIKADLNNFDIVILDILMPEMDGFDVLREIRKKSSLPVIMLTARGDVYDRIVGLELGADDYMSKPFEPRELLARIEAVLRRTRHEVKPQSVLKYESFTLNIDSMELRVNEKIEPLTSAEFELLKLFCTNPFKVLSRDRIMNEIKNIAWESFDRSVDVLVSRLRKKLHDNPSNPKIIKTVWGEGYMFIAGRKDVE